MTRLVPDQPTGHATCWLCAHNFSVELHIDRADPDQPLAAELAKAHQP